MADDRRPVRGRVLVALGFFLFGLAIFGPMFGIPRNPISNLLEDFIFLPLIMIFAGRSLQRRERKTTAAANPSQTSDNPAWMEEGRLPTLSETLRPKPAPVTPRPPMARPAPKPTPPVVAVPVPRAEPLVVPVAPPPARPPLAPASQSGAMVERSRSHESAPLHTPSGIKPKSSEEMIAEAKRRLSRKSS